MTFPAVFIEAYAFTGWVTWFTYTDIQTDNGSIKPMHKILNGTIIHKKRQSSYAMNSAHIAYLSVVVVLM